LNGGREFLQLSDPKNVFKPRPGRHLLPVTNLYSQIASAPRYFQIRSNRRRMNSCLKWGCTLALAAWSGIASAQGPAPAVTIHVSNAPKPISPDLFGIFFEDLNWAADGGLYGELLRNRSFEFSAEDHSGWNDLTGWDLVERGGGKGSITVRADAPLNASNPHYAVLGLQRNLGAAGIRNSGFDGIPLQAGEKYDFSVFARQLAGPGGPLEVRLEARNGDLLAEAKLPAPNSAWVKYDAVLEPAGADPDARLVLLTTGEGQVALDMVSLFPKKTFHGHPNGLRPDLAQAIADLHPRFMRFPGGCLVHGDGLDNIYNWKNTIGPVEQRQGQRNIWGYHQSVGLGFFEYFQFCEDIGAAPLPVVSAGVCCQNSGESVTKVWEQGQRGLAMTDMPAYIQNVLDLIEWANGPASSAWGARRAAAGHRAPFHLHYLAVGNEDKQTDVFRERFKLIYDAVKARYSDVTVIGTAGPRPDGEDFELGWKFADKLQVPMVDEHYYEKPEWFLNNLGRYDTYDRRKSRVYVGEYASQGNTLFNALAEAAYMTSLERNGDVVQMASYAPLLCQAGHANWRPDLIYFDRAKVVRSVNY
jgi:alpha-N-arabinofuranosidase